MKFVELDSNANISSRNKKKEDLEKRNEELSLKYNEKNNLLKTVVTQFFELLDVMRNGNASAQLSDAAQSTLAMATQQVLILPLKIFTNYVHLLFAFKFHVQHGRSAKSWLL
ncbi:ATP synthase subunit delta [Bienertia sinuspersici]